MGAGYAGVTIAGMTDPVSYPPEPWVLCGQMHVSVWLPPRGSRPSHPVPSGIRRLLVAGRTVVGTAWVDYQPGGVLAYRELLAAMLVRDGVRPRATITGIWVDSVPSRATVNPRPPGYGRRPGSSSTAAIGGSHRTGRWATYAGCVLG